MYTKGRCLKTKVPFRNYNFRSKSLFFVAGLNYSNLKNAFSSLVFSSSGCVSFIPFKSSDRFFNLCKLKSLNSLSPQVFKELLYVKPFLKIIEVPYMLIQQSKNSSISYLELLPLKGAQYSRSLGTSSYMIKLDTRIGLSLVKLPSGIKKLFSAFSLANAGKANLSIFKKELISTKCGSRLSKGIKPKVRGVAKNPVDHPHGGRTKAIKYQRTP